ncbi:MAG TPA: peptidoglycan DD-metalloendopeptidase family protein [Pseudomonadales bacterium]|jgi:lipoprotein NlpD|nr:peptidoglycan DD-metalloendopeptidase family protein [Pseudomonadales bacterium]HMW15405.1 peptidoglycan DD-metalloendopeptidase family protein [Pseudomonadales bacterium]HMW83523.1 peptidoglycan DD-metalloendopeptidase family protein [Pseudomonadales bacterium]HMY97148.1 peptidoglycan DD-metalloendopeptidase family protein [Pseudomonadales bacterium]HMZ71166.1 peptidoglycan DD-metalloendopeptidase family protein [Pseudomonadales bacterium]
MHIAARQHPFDPRNSRWLALLGITLLLCACASPLPLSDHDDATAENKSSKTEPRRTPPREYVVVKGDTLVAIAFRHGMDYRQLAALNGIKEPYTIYPGQRLRLSRDTSASSAGRSTPVNAKGSPVRTPAPAETSSVTSTLPWRWPVAGKVLRGYDSAGGTNKGIDIAAPEGTQVLAAAGGTVVYAGNGLRAYGNLLIIKHNDEFLSAYGYNRRLLVAEAEEVKVGQPIAETGSDGQTTGLLHFEIRRQGKPIDPLLYLPRQP